MNESVKEVLLNYAVCSLTGGVLSFIMPEKMRKPLKVIVTLFLISTVVFPLFRSEISIDTLFDEEVTFYDEQYSALLHTQSLLEKKLYDEMSEILINLGINEYEIYIETTADEEENTVYLEEIRIEIPKEIGYMAENIRNSVSQEYKDVLKVGLKNE